MERTPPYAGVTEIVQIRSLASTNIVEATSLRVLERPSTPQLTPQRHDSNDGAWGGENYLSHGGQKRWPRFIPKISACYKFKVENASNHGLAFIGYKPFLSVDRTISGAMSLGIEVHLLNPGRPACRAGLAALVY